MYRIGHQVFRKLMASASQQRDPTTMFTKSRRANHLERRRCSVFRGSPILLSALLFIMISSSSLSCILGVTAFSTSSSLSLSKSRAVSGSDVCFPSSSEWNHNNNHHLYDNRIPSWKSKMGQLQQQQHKSKARPTTMLFMSDAANGSENNGGNNNNNNNKQSKRRKIKALTKNLTTLLRQRIATPLRQAWWRFRRLSVKSQRILAIYIFICSLLFGSMTRSVVRKYRPAGNVQNLPPMEIAYSSFSQLVNDKVTSPLVQDVQIGADRISFRLQRPATQEQYENLQVVGSMPQVKQKKLSKMQTRFQLPSSSSLTRFLPFLTTPTDTNINNEAALSPPPQFVRAYTRRIDNWSPELDSLLSGLEGSYRAAAPAKTSVLVTGLRTALVGFYLLILWRFYKSIGAATGAGGKDNAVGRRATADNVETVPFDDIQGMDEAKMKVMELVTALRNPESYAVLGARPPKGLLLEGPPGTGKTMLARATAAAAGIPLVYCSGSEFVEMYVGRGAARVRSLFNKARAMSPCIIFIDELDALGKARDSGEGLFGGGLGGGRNDEAEQTLNQLLTCMDGLDNTESSKICVMAATNRRSVLDPALVRPGRFDRLVRLDLPNEQGRLAILRVHANKLPLFKEGNPNVDAAKVDLEVMAALTEGCSGADLALLCNEAALGAVRRIQQELMQSDTSRLREEGGDLIRHVCDVDFRAALQDLVSTRGWKGGGGVWKW